METFGFFKGCTSNLGTGRLPSVTHKIIEEYDVRPLAVAVMTNV
jgi:hypothetical protein